jgi:hypothetical protein
MEYVEGRNLEDVLEAEGPLSEEDARDTLAGIAAALAAAHAQEIIHRDVKPANILRDKQTGRIVLTDFGVAGIRDTGQEDTTSKLTVQGEVLGDMRYVSPEHLMGEPLTELADVYSLGVLGYELLTLRSPYEASSNADLAAGHLKRPPTPLAALRPEISPALAALLTRCLAKRPEHRPEAADVARLLLDDGEPEEGSEPKTALEGFFAELKRRHVYKVAVAYLAIAFFALEGVNMLLEPFDSPAWVDVALPIAVVAGFPIVLILAWVYDIRAGRITRTEELRDETEGRGLKQRRLLQAFGLVLSLGVAVLIAWRFLSR